MFEATQARMAAFEHLEGLLLPPEMHTVVRLELNNAPALFDDESLSLSGPLDGRFAKSMLKTAAHLIRETPESLFTFVAGDELVLLLDVESFIDRRSPRTLVARFVSMAAGKASLLFERSVGFDCHIYSLPGQEQAGDFFAWRQQAYEEWIVTTYCHEVMVSNGANPQKDLAQPTDRIHARHPWNNPSHSPAPFGAASAPFRCPWAPCWASG